MVGKANVCECVRDGILCLYRPSKLGGTVLGLRSARETRLGGWDYVIGWHSLRFEKWK